MQKKSMRDGKRKKVYVYKHISKYKRIEMSDFKNKEKKESTKSNDIKIVVVGVGGGGSNMVDNLVGSEVAKNVKLVAINTDAQALENSNAPNKLQIGEQTTKGRGSGMDPEVGKKAAIESYDKIKEILKK